MYEKYPYLCISAFCISVLFYIFTPEKGMKVYVPEVSAKEVTTATGKTAKGISMEIQAWGEEDSKEEWKLVEWIKEWNDKIWVCDSKCKISELQKKGIRDEIAHSLVINCKALTDDPVQCIKIGASIVKNESWWWFKCRAYNKYNCFWLQVKDDYKSFNDWVVHWVGKYEKRWYKAKNMAFFYSPAWSHPPSRYCTSEHSSNTQIWCPHGLKISTGFYNSLSF